MGAIRYEKALKPLFRALGIKNYFRELLNSNAENHRLISRGNGAVAVYRFGIRAYGVYHFHALRHVPKRDRKSVV